MDISPAGKGTSPRATAFGKRLRSPPGAPYHQEPWRSPAACDAFDEVALDNVRAQKRYLSESMATDLSRLNMAFGEEAGLATAPRGASSPSLSSMQTDRDSSNGGGVGACASPTLSDCFNPFDSPSVHSRDPTRAAALFYAGVPGRPPAHSPTRPGAAPASSPVRLRPSSSSGPGGGSSCLGTGSEGPPGSPMCGTPARGGGGGHVGRRGMALDAGERLPPSPSDPQLGMDLRKTALLRSLLLRTEEKGKGTPGAGLRRRSRMSDAMLCSPAPGRRAGAPSRRGFSAFGSPPDGCADADMLSGSLSSDEDDGEQQDDGVRGGNGGGIFSLSDTEADDLKLRERASLILGDAAKTRARLDAFDTGLRPT